MQQNPLQEFIQDMERAVFELLQLWNRQNKALPDVIIMFRDGVSEGQFRPVLAEELAAIKRVRVCVCVCVCVCVWRSHCACWQALCP
jgi:hypothetical protein